MQKIITLVCAIVLLTSPIAKAEDAAAIKREGAGTFVTLSASEQKKVEQDLLVASLRIELDNKDSRKVQDEINKAMQKTMDIIKAEPAIKANTGNYYVYSYNPNPSAQHLTPEERLKHMIWKGSQSIELKSKDAQKLLDVVARVQDSGFAMNGLNYMLSPELVEVQKDELLVGALKKIKAKAELVSHALGKSGYDIVEVNIDGNYMPQPQPVMMMRKAGGADMASDSMASPVAVPSEDDVTLSVSARIQLK